MSESVHWKKKGSRARMGAQRLRVYGTEAPKMRMGRELFFAASPQRSWRTREREPSAPIIMLPAALVPSSNVAVMLEGLESSKEAMHLFHYNHKLAHAPDQQLVR